MRGLVGLYLAIGIALVAIGFLLPGPCPNRNIDIVNQIVFVLTWPVGLVFGGLSGPPVGGRVAARAGLPRRRPARAENGSGLAEPEIRTGAAP